MVLRELSTALIMLFVIPANTMGIIVHNKKDRFALYVTFLFFLLYKRNLPDNKEI